MAKANEEKEFGNSCFKSGKFKEAHRHYSNALSLGVDLSHKVFCNRSLVNLKLGNSEAALVDANKALKLDASFVKAYYRRGEAFRVLGEIPLAIRAFCDGLSRADDPDCDMVLRLIEVVLTGETSRAFKGDSDAAKAVQKGKRFILKSIQKYFIGQQWLKVCTIWKNSPCRQLKGVKDDIKQIMPTILVAEILENATTNEELQILDVLVDLGFNPNVPFGMTGSVAVLPIQIARYYKNQKAAVKLLSLGAHPVTFFTTQDKEESFLSHVVAAWTMKINEEDTTLLDFVLDRHPYGTLSVDNDGNSLLHAVCKEFYKASKARRAVISNLLRRGCRPDQYNKARKTPLDLLDTIDWRRSMMIESLRLTRPTRPIPEYERQYDHHRTRRDAGRMPPYPAASASAASRSQSAPTYAKATKADAKRDDTKSAKAKPKPSYETREKQKPGATTKGAPPTKKPTSNRQQPAPALISQSAKSRRGKTTAFQGQPDSTKPSDSMPLGRSQSKEQVSAAGRAIPKPVPVAPKPKAQPKVKQEHSDLQNRRRKLQELLNSTPEKSFLELRLVKAKEAKIPKTKTENEVSNSADAQKNASVISKDLPKAKDLPSVKALPKESNKSQFPPRGTEGRSEGPWEVRWTSEVWKFLQGRRSDTSIVTQVLEKLQMLSDGEFRPRLCRPIQGVPKGVMLFETNVNEKVRLIWDMAPAFSPRLSLVQKEKEGMEGSRHVFSEVIRVWDVILDHDSLDRKKKKILKSYKKGESAVCVTYLEGDAETIPKNDLRARLDNRRKSGPRKFNSRYGQSRRGAREPFDCFPPANPDEKEFNIVKFYPVTGEMMTWFLSNDEEDVDFLFDVNPDEFEIINSEQKVSTLLLGRSGTGKTTCCLYKMWRSFEKYWRTAQPDNPQYKLPEESESIAEHETYKKAELPKTGFDISSVFDDWGSREGPVKILPPLAERTMSDEGYCPPSTTPEKTVGTAKTVAPSDDSSSVELSIPIGEQFKECHLQQIFITKNGLLCDRMRKCFLGLSHAHDFTRPHRKFENNRLPYKIQDFDALQFPCFLTMRQWLLLLDASLPGDSFFERLEDGSMICRINTWGDIDGLLGTLSDLEDDSESERESDPGDGDSSGDEEFCDISGHLTGAINRTTTDFDKSKRSYTEITYSYFESKMWPKVSKGFSSSYDPLLVWTEIKSFIEGSIEALHSHNGYLGLEDYCNIGRKRAPNFEGNREEIYKIFDQYRKMKSQQRAYDECDLVYQLYQRLFSLPVFNWTVNQLYVDETQDFTQAEIALLMRCCQNPNAIFLTGDTAQSIMRGVSFRFKDMKTLFHYAQQAQPKKRIGVPSVSHLQQNYRSHSGILEVASSVVDLMECYFKESFDVLPKDQGLFTGPKPTYLETTGPDSLALMLMGNKRKTSALEFGAHQVVLVRSDESLKNLPNELKCAIAMTIFDAKGLEFDDVLLYNFFTDSKRDSDWRIIYSYIKEKCPDHDLPSECRPLEFRPTEHKFLGSELKHLYTAVTRARCNLWIYDHNENKRRPMLEYLKAKDLVEIATSEEELNREESAGAFSFVASSTPKQWEKRGYYFLSHKSFRPAATCFQKARITEKYNYCWACLCLTEAFENEQHGQRIDAREKWVEAATHFLRADKSRRAARCLLKAGEKELAAKVLEKFGYPGQAAKLYQGWAKVDDTARCWRKALDFGSVTELLYRQGRYEDAAEAVRCCTELSQKHPELAKDIRVPSKTYAVDSLLWRAAKVYYAQGKLNDMRRVVDSFPEFENRVKFFRKTGQVDEIADVLMRDGRFEDLKAMLWEKGRFIEAAEKFKDESKFQGDCYLAHVMAFADVEDIQTRCKHLEKAKESYQACRDKFGVGSCLLLEGELKNDISCFLKAREIFRKMNCWCGEIEATAGRARLKFDTDQDLTNAKHAIESAIQLCRSVFQSRSADDRHQVEGNCARFYGLVQSNAMEYTFCPKTKCRFLPLYQKCQKDIEGLEHVVEKRLVHSLLAKHIVSVLTDLVARSQEYVKRQMYTACKPCRNSVVGFGCADSACQELHDTIGAGFWNQKIHYIVLATKVEMAALSARESLRTFPDCKEGLEALRPRLDDLVYYLKDVICPTSWQLCLIPLNGTCERGLLELRNETVVRKKLADLIERSWLRENRRVGNVNLVQMYWSLFTVVDGKDGVRNFALLLKKDQNSFIELLSALQPRLAWYRRQRHGDRSSWNSPPEYCNLFTNLWMNARRRYSSGDIIGSAKAMMEMLKVSMGKPMAEKRAPPPLLTQTLNILEMSSQCCILTLLHLLPFNEQDLYLPGFYVETAAFWDVVTQQDADFLVNAIQDIELMGDIVSVVRRFLCEIIDVITGRFEQRFYILRFCFTRNNCIESGGTERMLILAITLLLNCVKLDGFKEKAKLLAMSLSHLYKDFAMGLPNRLLLALDAVSRSGTGYISALSELLQHRGEKLLRIAKEKGKLQFIPIDLKSCTDSTATKNVDEETGFKETEKDSSVEDSGDVATKNVDEETGFKEEETDSLVDSGESGFDMDDEEKEELIEKGQIEEAERFYNKGFQRRYFDLWLLRQKQLPVQRELAGRNAEDEGHFGRFRVDKSGCTICRVEFGHVAEDDPELSATAQLMNDHSASPQHLASQSHFLKYKEGYPLFQEVQQEMRKVLMAASSHDILDLPKDSLEDELTEFGRTVHENEQTVAWEAAVKYLKYTSETLRVKSSEMKKKIEDLKEKETSTDSVSPQNDVSHVHTTRREMGEHYTNFDDIDSDSDDEVPTRQEKKSATKRKKPKKKKTKRKR